MNAHTQLMSIVNLLLRNKIYELENLLRNNISFTNELLFYRFCKKHQLTVIL